MIGVRFGMTALMLALGAAPAVAQAPVAMVEDVKAASAGVEFMDYVAPGKVIKLGTNGQLTLGYLKSCWREVIVGGTVTVGTEQSVVDGGTAQRSKIACEAGKMQLTAELASKSGAMVFREGPRTKSTSVPQPRPQFTLYGQSPLVEMTKANTLVIERLDQPGERYEIVGANTALVRGTFYDFAADNKALAKAGIYRATMGNVQVVFQIAPNAEPGHAPAAGRLLRLLSAN